MTSTALATTSAVAGLTPQSIDEAQSIAERLAASTLVPDHFRGKPADCFMAIAYGVELGLPPVTSLASIAVVKGKPTLYAATMVALVLSSGKAEYFHCIESDSDHATYETLRKGSKLPRRYTFTQADAKTAGLGNMYKTYPQQMLEARAKSFLARDVYPDVLHGLQGYEEVIDIEPAHSVDVAKFEDPENASAAEPADAGPAEDDTAVDADAPVSSVDQILGCASLEELEGLIPALKALKGDERAEALKLYKEHKKTLERQAA